MKRILFISAILFAVVSLFAACGSKSNKDSSTMTEPIKQQEYNITYHMNDGKSGSVKRQTEKRLDTSIISLKISGNKCKITVFANLHDRFCEYERRYW